MKKFDPSDLKPCPHMVNLVSAHVDGKLSGIAEWYTKAHIKGCKQCQASIPFIESLKDRLGEIDGNAQPSELAPERIDAISAALERIDAEHTAN